MNTKIVNTSIEEIYANMRKLFNVQLHEFYRQYKEKTLNPESLLEEYEKGQEFLQSVISSAENKDEAHFGLKEQLDIVAAEFATAFLLKLDEEYPEDE